LLVFTSPYAHRTKISECFGFHCGLVQLIVLWVCFCIVLLTLAIFFVFFIFCSLKHDASFLKLLNDALLILLASHI